MSLLYLEMADLLERGYFPKELPPPFNTVSFVEAVTSQTALFFNEFTSCRCWTKPVTHMIPRVRRLRRKLSIPNPIAFFQLSKEIVENKEYISELFKGDSYSVTTPHVNGKNAGRAVIPSKWFTALPKMRSKLRANAKFLVKADVSKFYHSIYTHSIPWAIHSKARAKRDHSDALLGNRLDKCLRKGQDGQTIGIPIGPDTSLIIAEIILSQADKEIFKDGKVSGFRFLDDYEISCKSMAEVEYAISTLETVLSQYELQLGTAKLKVIELPCELDNQWAIELRSLKIEEDSEKSQYYSLLNFINLSYKAMKENEDDNVAVYCIKRLSEVSLLEGNKDFVFEFLMHCFNVQPSSIGIIIQILCEKFSLSSAGEHNKNQIVMLQKAMMQVLKNEVALHHNNEVAWILWACIVFNLRIENGIFKDIIKIIDSIVALLSLDAYSRKLVDGEHSFENWEYYLNSNELCEEMWLLAYEATVQEWLSPLDSDFINTYPQFKLLKDNHVFFYESKKLPIDLVPKLPKSLVGSPGFSPGGYVSSPYF